MLKTLCSCVRIPHRLNTTERYIVNAIPLSQLRNLTINAALTEFGDTIDKEHAAQYPYAYGVIDRLGLPCIRFRTSENIEDSIDRLLPLPKEISVTARHGEVIRLRGKTFVVLENHGDDINEMVLSATDFVDVLL